MTTPHRKERDASSGADPPCIWMKAGLVAYKLCDRDLDCDGCPFDAAMSGATPRRTVAQRRRPAGELRDDRRYHPAHTWVQVRRGGRLRCGIDAFAAQLLIGLEGVILPAVGSQLWQDRTGAWIAIGGTDLVALRTPVSGKVLRQNERLRAWPALAAAAPYDDGWLLEVAPGADSQEDRGLLSADEMAQHTDLRRRALREKLTRLAPPQAQLGPTLPDGGEPAADLRALLGRRRYLELVRSLLG